MKITDYLDALNLTLDIKRFPNQGERWSCSIEKADVKGDSVLIGVHGNADSPTGAIYDYIAQIQDQTLVLNAHTKERQEYQVPTELIY